MSHNGKNLDESSAMGLYMAQARKIPLLSPEEESALARTFQQGGPRARMAQDKLIVSNLRLVTSIAWKYVRPDLPLEDLVQEGNLGLMHAITKFDPDKGFRLITYAHWWVHQAIRRYIAESGRLVRVPVNKALKIAEMNRVVAALSKSGEVPSDAEVAQALGVDVEVVRELAVYSTQPVSIHSPIFDDDEGEFGDTLVDESAGPEESYLDGDMKAKLRAALGSLKPRDAEVLTMRFGLDGEEPRTLEEVGAVFGVTRERIRQIEGAALKQLAKGESGRMLRQLL